MPNTQTDRVQPAVRSLCAAVTPFLLISASAQAINGPKDSSAVAGEPTHVVRIDQPLLSWLDHMAAPPTRVMAVASQSQAPGTGLAAAAVEQVGGTVLWSSEEGVRLDAMLTPQQVVMLLENRAIESFELWSPPSVDGPVEREVSGAVVLENELGLTGAGVVGGIADRGLFVDHVEFLGRPPLFQTENTDALSHGTATFGILFSAGDGDAMARGMLPDATGVFASYDLFDDRDAVIADLFSPETRGVFQSNSWGGARTRVYSTASVELDDIIFRRDTVLVQSQSNTGDQDSRPEAWAKNGVSVGGVNANETADFSDDTWAGGASSGPALDGRVKPDLVHFNNGVLTTDDDGPEAYRTFTGTSASAPLVAGVFGLFHELWATGELGNAVGGGDVYDERPSSALARAMLINTARRYPFTSPADDLGRFRQGWGVPDVGALWNARDRLAWFDHPVRLEQGESAAFGVFADGTSDVRFTLVYTDPPAPAFSTRTTINDLDLVVESPAGVIYRGNVGLFEGNESRPGGEPDAANTVENVFIPAGNAAAGSWTVRVVATSVSVDGEVSTPAIDQGFALVVTGAEAVSSGFVAPFLVDPIPARSDTPWQVRAAALGDIDGTTARLVIRRGGQSVEFRQMLPDENGVLTAPGPVVGCRGITEMGVEILAGSLVVSRWPRDGSLLPIPAPRSTVAVDDAFDTPGGWFATTAPDRGEWMWADPSGGGLRNDPPFDAPGDGNGAAWVTQDGPGLRDVAEEPVVLESPAFDLTALPEPVLTFHAWVACDDAGVGTPTGVVADDEDVMVVSASADGGSTWSEVDRVRSTFRWSEREVSLDEFAGEADVRVRFEIVDAGNNSMTEAAVDRVRIDSVACPPCVSDIDGNGSYDLNDSDGFISLVIAGARAVDFDRSGVVDLPDIDLFVVSAANGCD